MAAKSFFSRTGALSAITRVSLSQQHQAFASRTLSNSLFSVLSRNFSVDASKNYGVLAIPTVPGPPPLLQTDPSTLETFRAKAFGLLSIAGVSGFCQVTIPLGLHDNLPVSVSLLARHGSDGFLLNVVEALYNTLKEQNALARY